MALCLNGCDLAGFTERGSIYTRAFTNREIPKLTASLVCNVKRNNMKGLPGTNIISAIVILAKCKTDSICTQILALVGSSFYRSSS